MTPQEIQTVREALKAQLNVTEWEEQEEANRLAHEALALIDAALAQPEQKPYAIAYEYDGPFGLHRSFSHEYRNGKYPDRSFPVYAAPVAQQKDAERYQWLAENSYDKEGVTQFHVSEHSWEPHSQTGEPTEWKVRLRGPTNIDAAIDKAMEGV